MTEPSNSHLEGQGAIILKADPVRKSLRISIHFVTVNLEAKEAGELVIKLLQVGLYIYGPEWVTRVCQTLGLQPIIQEDIGFHE
jgi:hypothetical protein